jgi:hypothetical protein
MKAEGVVLMFVTLHAYEPFQIFAISTSQVEVHWCACLRQPPLSYHPFSPTLLLSRLAHISSFFLYNMFRTGDSSPDATTHS